MTLFRSKAEQKLVERGLDPGRLPPGQYLTEKWPVLHAGSVPQTDLATWEFRISGEVEAERAVRPRPRRAGIHVQRPARGARRRACADRVGSRRGTIDAGPRLAASARRPVALFLEEREVAARARASLR